MVGKIQGGTTSPIRTPAAPEKAAAAPKPQTAAAAAQGWGPKGSTSAQKLAAAQRNGASPVKLLKAGIDDGPVATGIPAPKGFEVSLGNDKRSEKATLPNGKVATMDWDSQTLAVKNTKTGKTTELVGKDDKYFKQFQEEFRSTFNKDMTADDLQYLPDSPGYDSQRGFTGAGSAGQLLSVSEGGSEYTGGAHPNSGSSLRTFDLRTGQPVKLDQLLSKEQFQSVVKAVTSQLPKLRGEDGITGETFGIYGDPAQHIAENFSISADKNGKVQIDVAWESGVHALGGQMAHFSFAAPTDEAFKQKIGVE